MIDVCKYCSHVRRSHSKNGCTHSYKKAGQCPCTIDFNDKKSFEPGTPLND